MAKQRAQTLYTAGGTIAFQASSLIVAVIVSRAFGPEGQGRLQLLVSIVMVVTLLSTGGVGEALAYLLPQEQARAPQRIRALISAVVVKMLIICTAIGTIFFLLAKPIAQYLIPIPDFDVELRYVFPILVSSVLLTLCAAVLRGVQRSDLRAIYLYFVVGLGLTGSMCLIVAFEMQIVAVYWARAFVFGGAAFLALLSISRLIPSGTERADLGTIRKIWTFGGLMTPVGVFQYVINQPLIDLIAIGLVADQTTVGIYAVVVRVAGISLVGFNAVLTVTGPSLSAMVSRGELDSIADHYERVADWGVLSTSFVAGLLAVLGPEVLGLFGPAFGDGAVFLYVMLVGNVLVSLLGPTGALVLATGNVRIQFWSTLAMAVFFLVSTFVAATLFGAMGVAIATLMSMLGLQGLRFWWCRRYYSIRPSRRCLTFLVCLMFSVAIALEIRAIAENSTVGLAGALAVLFAGALAAAGLAKLPLQPRLILAELRRP